MIPGTSDLVVTQWGAQFGKRRFPCSVGWGGISVRKCEGDGITPRGRFRLENILFRPDRVAAQELPDCAEPIRLFEIWSDDPRDPKYNRKTSGSRGYGFSHERLFRADPQYDIIVPVAYNRPDPVPGAGSAIFLHVWRSPWHPTAGCIAFRRIDLLWIANHIDARTSLVVD